MRKITYKQVVVIDGTEHVISTADYSQSVVDYSNNSGQVLNIGEIVAYVQEEEYGQNSCRCA